MLEPRRVAEGSILAIAVPAARLWTTAQQMSVSAIGAEACISSPQAVFLASTPFHRAECAELTNQAQPALEQICPKAGASKKRERSVNAAELPRLAKRQKFAATSQGCSVDKQQPASSPMPAELCQSRPPPLEQCELTPSSASAPPSCVLGPGFSRLGAVRS